MPATINLTPVQVSTDPQYRQSGGTNFGEQNPYIFKVGSNLYQVLCAVQVGEARMGIFKRTVSNINGNWTAQPNGLDAAHAPDPLHQSGTLQATLNGTKIAFIYLLDDGVSLKLCEFDTTTDTYGSPTSALTVSNFSSTFCFYVKSNGNYVVVGNTSTQLYYVTNIAGVWGSITNLRATTAQTFNGVVTPADVAHFVINETGFRLTHYSLDASFTLSSGTLLAGNWATADKRPTASLFGSASVAFAFVDSNAEVVVHIGTPLAAPVFTLYTIYSEINFEDLSYASLALGTGGDLNVFYSWTDFHMGDPGVPQVRVFQSTFDGVSTWSTPSLFYDAVANPPPNAVSPINQQIVHADQFIQLPQGWTAAVALETLISAVQYCTGFFLDQGPVGSPTLTLGPKVVVGGTALPTDFTLTFTGSSSASGAGGVGPAVVTAGMFNLSEIGPAQYVGVWNCGPAVMPTPTSVVVPPAGTTNAPVQVSSDAQYRPFTPGIGPYEFKVGTNLYQVLVSAQGGSPEGKVGMFKRAIANVGGAWAEMNAAGSPDQGNQSGYGKAVLSVSGTIITVAYLVTGQLNLKLCSFNTMTDSWGSPTAAVTVESALGTFAFGQQPSGQYVIVAGGINHLYYITNLGGVWSAIQNIFLNPRTTVYDGFVDSTGATHFVAQLVPPGAEYRRLSPTFVIGSPQGVLQSITLTSSGWPSVVPWGSTGIAIGYLDQGGMTPLSAEVQTGAPLGAPILSGPYVIHTPTGSETVSWVRPVTAADGTSLSVFYVDIDYTLPMDQVSQSNFNGTTWSAPTKFYDAVANPPTGGTTPASSQFIQAIQAMQLSPQGWTVAAAMQIGTSPVYSTGEFLELGATVQNVVCILTNTFNPSPPPPPTGGIHTLRYEIPQQRWFPHKYLDGMRQHYLDEADADKPNDMQLLMLSGANILKSGGNTDRGTDITTLAYLPSNDGGDERGQKLYIDTMVEADQTGNITSQVRFNNAQQVGPTVVMSPTGLRQQFLENISSLADLRLYRNIMAILSWTGGPDGPRIYAFEPSGYAQPYISTFFVTQYINLAYPGWKHGRRFYPALISNSPVLLTVETQDNRVYGPYIIPSTGGQFRIIPMILNHGVKDLAFALQLDGQGQPFALFPGEFTIELKGWTDPQYIELAVFRT